MAHATSAPHASSFSRPADPVRTRRWEGTLARMDKAKFMRTDARVSMKKRTGAALPRAASELLDTQAGITNDAAHREAFTGL